MHRSYARRRNFLRPDTGNDECTVAPDTSYDARDRCRVSVGRANVTETATLIRNWASKMPTTANLAAILQDWPNIKGYDRSFDKILLSDVLTIEMALEWGPLVNLCRFSKPKDKYRLMFLFAVMSFRHDIDMTIVRTLIAFSVFNELKELDFPNWPSYVQFRQNQVPHMNYILQLLKPFCIHYPTDDQRNFQFKLSSKERKKLAAAESAYEQQVEDDCKAFAQYLLNQWPCPELSITGFQRPVLIDTAKALENILPEWVRLCHNLELSEHIGEVQIVLNCHHASADTKAAIIDVLNNDVFPVQCCGIKFLTFSQDLLSKNGPNTFEKLEPVVFNIDQNFAMKQTHENIASSTDSSGIQELEDIVDGIARSQSNVRQQYACGLKQSLEAQKQLKCTPKKRYGSLDPNVLSAEISNIRHATKDQFHQICEAFEKGDCRVQ